MSQNPMAAGDMGMGQMRQRCPADGYDSMSVFDPRNAQQRPQVSQRVCPDTLHRGGGISENETCSPYVPPCLEVDDDDARFLTQAGLSHSSL